jgi:CRP-like cAMP-binding protein
MVETVSNDVKKAFIKKQAFFSQFTEEEVDMLSTLFIEQTIPAGKTIVTEGDPVDSVYLIVTGKADVQHVTMKDRVRQIETLAALNDGASIGLSSTGFYSLSGVRTATVEAKTDVLLLRLSLAAFNGFKLAYPRINELMRLNNAEALANLGNDS